MKYFIILLGKFCINVNLMRKLQIYPLLHKFSMKIIKYYKQKIFLSEFKFVLNIYIYFFNSLQFQFLP